MLAGGTDEKPRWIFQKPRAIERDHDVTAGDAYVVQLIVIKIVQAIGGHAIADGTQYGFRSHHDADDEARRLVAFVEEVEVGSAFGRAHWSILSQARVGSLFR
jgi:hypothetical protein